MTSTNTTEPTYALALHTSGTHLGLALSNFDNDERQQVWELGRDLATYLYLFLQEFLRPQHWQDLQFLAVAVGPGGFTGTRIGVVTARTLAQQLEIPLYGVSTLAAIAYHKYRSYPEHRTPLPDLAIALPAQRGQLHTALYRQTSPNLEAILPDEVRSPEEWAKILTTYETPYETIEANNSLGEMAIDLLHLAHIRWQQGDRPDWSTVVPYYGQHPVHR
ncbi:MAG: tRNA (adenosine(37)-N6)-threonylcarbamoyltransferase complex dimerization subunit type 1 TsaB [Cyanobacteria bacterium J06638_22]